MKIFATSVLETMWILSTLVLAGVTSTAAAELELGSIQIVQGQTGNLILTLAPAAGTAAVALKLQANATNLELQSAVPAAGYDSFEAGYHSPVPGTLNVVIYHDPTATFTGGAQILNIRVKARENAALGPQTVTLSTASVSDAAGVSQPNVQLVNGTVTISSGTQNFSGTVSGGETDQHNVAIGTAANVEVVYALSGAAQPGCTVTLTIKKPGNVTLGPFTLSSSPQTESLAGASGTWSFLVTGSGACSNQAYTLTVRQIFSTPVVDAPLLAAVIVLIAGLLALRIGFQRRVRTTR